MPEPTKIPRPFAASGDKNSIPDSSGGLGFASWQEGFPAITGTPFAQGGVAPKRADFNGVFNALSAATVWAQQGGVYAYDSNTDYEAGNVVLDAGGLYVANAANGPSSSVVQPSTDTTGATWKLLRLDLATQAAAGYMSGADKTKLDGLISTDATQSAAGYMSAADKTRLDSVILTDATPTAAGYMSAADKTRLDSVILTDATPTAAGYMSAADKTRLDSVILTDATPTAAGYMSAADKTKLDGLIQTGIWTPVLVGSTTPGAFVYGSNTAGQYIKIGSLVYVHGFITITSYTTYPTGFVNIKGLPYIAANESMLFNIQGNGASVNGSFFRFVGASIARNTSHIGLRTNSAHPSATSQGQVSYANWVQGTTDYFGVEYSSGDANIMIDGLYVAL